MQEGMQTFTVRDFSGGLDKRPGAYSGRDANRFNTLLNAYPTVNKRVRRRPPIKLAEGAFGADGLGLVPINGALYSLVPRGTVATLPTAVSALYFDVPFGATAHALTDAVALGDTIVAMIAHTIAGATRYFLHVFDSAPDLPTYVLDPAFPWMHEISPTVAPVITVAASKVWVSTKDGQVAHSGVNHPRVWNTLARETFVSRGHEFHVYCAAAGASTFTIPLDAGQISQNPMSGFLAWVVEQFTGTGTPDYTVDGNWATRLGEVNAAPAAGQCRFQSTANTSTGATYTTWITVTINASAAGWFRVRILPPHDGVTQQVTNFVVSGIWSPTQNVSANRYFRGDGVTKQFVIDDMRYIDPAAFPASVFIDGVLKASPADYSLVQESTDKKRLQINFVAAPADGVLVRINQPFVSAVVGKVQLHPGVVQTAKGERQFNGTEMTTFTAMVNGVYNYFLNLNGDGEPSGTVTVIEPGGFITGKQRYEGVWIGSEVYGGGASAFGVPVYNGARYPDTGGVLLYDYRDTLADGKLYGAVGSLFGAKDAGTLPAAANDSSGGPVRLLGATRGRLLVMYAGGCELWSVNLDPARDIMLDTSPIGAGDQATPHSVVFFNSLMVPSATGVRSIEVTGQLGDTAEDANIGSPVADLGVPQVLTSVFWPYLSHYVAAVTLDGEFSFLGLSYHARDKVSGWYQATAAGITTVDYRTMIPIGSRLYFRSGTLLYYFDGSAELGVAGAFKDDNDGATAYEAVAEPHLNDLGRPGLAKKYRALDIVQTGVVDVTFRRLSNGAEAYQPGPRIDGATPGMPRCRLAMIAQAIAPRFSSTDDSGWELQSYSYDFELCQR